MLDVSIVKIASVAIAPILRSWFRRYLPTRYREIKRMSPELGMTVRQATC
jgi:hypothetical protein